jgi:PKD repeat protein
VRDKLATFRFPKTCVWGSKGSLIFALGLGALMVMGSLWVPASAAAAGGAPAAQHRPTALALVAARTAVPGALPGAGRVDGQPESWINVSSGPSPGAVGGASMAYDPLLHETVLFGGYRPPPGRSTVLPQLNSTWAFRNGTWANVTSISNSPPSGRLSASLIFDARDGYLILTGGYGVGFGYNDSANCSSACNDTWEYGSGGWAKLPNPTGNPYHGISVNGTPVDWMSSSATFDSTDGYVLVLNAFEGGGYTTTYGNTTQGQTWSLVGSNWTDLSYNQSTNSTRIAPNYVLPVLVNDPAAGGVVMFGGGRFYNNGSYGFWASNATWLYSHGTWTNVSSNSTLTPPAMYPGIGAYDNASQSVLLFDDSSTWEWKNFQWTNVTPAVSPVRLGDVVVPASLAWDGDANATVLYGGVDSRASGAPFDNSTWEWTSHPVITQLSIASSVNPLDPGIATNFSVASVGGVPPFSYSWRFGDGSTSTAAAPSHSYATSGRYDVSLTLEDSLGHLRNASTSVVVSTTPALSPGISPDPTDVGISTEFMASSSGGTQGPGTTYVWSFGDASPPKSGGTGNGSSNNSSDRVGPGSTNHTYSGAGNYSPQIWWNDSGGSRLTRVLSLLVNPALRVPTISASPSDPYLGQIVNFTAKATGGTQPYRYVWQFGDGGTGGNLENISHVYTTNGPFLAQVKITDAAGATVTGTENITTALNLSAFANVSFGAAPLPVGFVSHVTGGNPGYRYAWRFGDGGTSELSDPVHTYSAGGTYRATVVVTDQSGNAVSNSWNVTVATGGGPVSVSLTVGSPEIPLGASNMISATVNGGQGAYALRWTQVPAGCREVGLVDLNCTPTAAGQFAVVLAVTDSQGGSGNASAQFAVGSQNEVTPLSPEKTVISGVAPWLAAGIAVLAAMLAVLVGVVIGRGGLGESTPPTEPEDPKYAGFRGPPPGTPGGPTVADPIDELF